MRSLDGFGSRGGGSSQWGQALEERRTDADHIGPFLDRDLKVLAHAHAQGQGPQAGLQALPQAAQGGEGGPGGGGSALQGGHAHEPLQAQMGQRR
jgi:hypothetical protein